ncbi:MAG TPA: ABC transporter permease [Nitrospiria bacterium]|jgi:putative ABC transport system permease protein
MFLLAWRQLCLDPARTFLTALALGAVIAVVLTLEGFEQGQYYQLARTVFNRQADLIVTQAGVSNLMAVRSSIPQLSREKVESIAGVVNAHPLAWISLIYEKEGEKTPVFLFVVDTKGGPVHMVRGNGIPKGKEIILNDSLAKKYHLNIGDPFVVFDFEFTVVGISKDSAALFTPFAFVNFDGMIDLFIETDIAPDLTTFPMLSFLLVDLEPGAQREAVAEEIERRVPEVDVFTPGQLAESDMNMGRGFLGPVMGLLVFVGYIIGLLVVGLVMYAEVRSRLRNFGVLKALGFTHVRLIYGIILQALLLLMISIPVGVILGLGTASFIHTFGPVYLIRWYEPTTFLSTILGSGFFAILGALIPLRSIRRADPMLAFQGE